MNAKPAVSFFKKAYFFLPVFSKILFLFISASTSDGFIRIGNHSRKIRTSKLKTFIWICCFLRFRQGRIIPPGLLFRFRGKKGEIKKLMGPVAFQENPLRLYFIVVRSGRGDKKISIDLVPLIG
jgi:hypothetical protein